MVKPLPVKLSMGMCWSWLSTPGAAYRKLTQTDSDSIPSWNLQFDEEVGSESYVLVSSYWSINPPTTLPTHSLPNSKKDARNAPYSLAWSGANGARVVDACGGTYEQGRYIFSMPSPPFAASSPLCLDVMHNPSVTTQRQCLPWRKKDERVALRLTLTPRPYGQVRYWMSIKVPGMQLDALIMPHCVSRPGTWCVARLIITTTTEIDV